MFGKILGKKGTSNSEKLHLEIRNKISTMNLTDMRAYVKGNMPGFNPSEDGLSEIMNKLLVPDEKSAKLYIEFSDMDSKKKKAFDLVILVAQSKKMSVDILEKIQKFTEVYQELLVKFDTDNKQIYASKLNDSLSVAIKNVNKLSELNNKMRVLKE